MYPNNWQYSTIRAWLNGLDVVKSDDPLENDKTYTNNGFLQTAFTADAQSLIAYTSVDNSAASTNPASNPKQWELMSRVANGSRMLLDNAVLLVSV